MENKHVTGAVFGLGALWTYLASLPWSTISYMVGSAVAILGLVLGWWWQQRKDRREAEYWAAKSERESQIAEATIAALKSGKVTLINESVDETSSS